MAKKTEDKKPVKKPEEKKTKKTEDKKPVKKPEEKKTKKTEDKKPVKKPEEKKQKLIEKKKTKAELKEAEFTDEDLEAIDEKEIENFEIEGLDMDKLKTNVLELITKRGDNGMFQTDLWKKLKLSNRDGARLALKLERQHLVKREKILENGRWIYKLKIAHVPVTTKSIESAPCLICPVESKCTLEGEVSPKTCSLIEQWVYTDISTKKTKK